MGSKVMMESCEVFETSDLPEADQAILQAREDTSDSIETLHVSPNEAFGRFKSSYLDSNSVDFSDKLRNSRRKGYTVVWSGEPEVGEEESALKKYQRLNCEARELQEAVERARAGGGEGEVPRATLEALAPQVELLHRQLVALRVEEVGGGAPRQEPGRQKLLAQLGALGAGGGRGGAAPPLPGTYSLHLRPSQGGLAELGARLAALEATVGVGEEQLAVLCMETNRKTITEAVTVLASKTALLDPYYLDHVEGRLGALQHKLQHLAAPSPRLEPAAAAKLDSLLASAERGQALYARLGERVERAESLQAVHARAAEVAASLVELEAVEEHLASHLHTNLALLRATRDKLPANMAAIEANFASLFARIENLQKAGRR